MSAELTQALCVDVAAALGLPHPGLVEKDFHVVRALAALAVLEHDRSYADDFDIFQRDMVYGEHAELQACLPILREYADSL